MKSKCLNCNVEIETIEGVEVLWCSIKCKKEFYAKYFAGNVDVRIWEHEYDEHFKEGQKKVMKKIRESGLTASEYIRSLGDFKEDDAISEKTEVKKDE